MLLLLNGDDLQVVIGTTGTYSSHASFADYDDGPPVVVTPGRDNQLLTTAGTYDAVDGPGSGVVRNVKTFHFRNTHASTSSAITIQHDDATDVVELWKGTLAAQESIAYIEGIGFQKFDTAGVPVLQTVKLDRKLYVTSDSLHATANTFADITGLTCPVQAAKVYNFEAHLFHIENAATTGSRFAVNGPAATEVRVGGVGVYTGSLTAAVMQAQVADIAALDTAVPGTTTASTATPQVTLFILTGYYIPSTAGTFAVRCASEISVAAGVTVKKGSWARIWEVDN